MKAFAKILVPVDFLPHSAEAVRRAMDLAIQHSAQVVLFHAYEPGEYPATPGAVIYDAEQLHHMSSEVRARLDAVRRDADPSAAGVSAPASCKEPLSAIIEVVTREPFDLIVMGTHGRTGVGRVVLGSVAEQVMRRAPCPVLIIKAPRASAIERAAPEAAPSSRWSFAALLGARSPRHALRPATAHTLESTHAAPRGHLPPRV